MRLPWKRISVGFTHFVLVFPKRRYLLLSGKAQSRELEDGKNKEEKEK